MEESSLPTAMWQASPDIRADVTLDASEFRR
jgi:hypothetical protein